MGSVHGGLETSLTYHLPHRRKSRVRAFMFFRANSNNGGVRIAHALNDAIKKTYVPLLSDVIFEGDVVPPPSRIPWCAIFPMYIRCVRLMLCLTRYPEDLAWQFNVSKKVLRKQQAFKKFHSFLVHETEVVRDPSPRVTRSMMNVTGQHIKTRSSQYASTVVPRCPAAP